MRLKITGKLIVGFGGLFLISLILGMMSIYKLNIIESAEKRIRNIEYPSVKIILNSEKELTHIRRLSYEYAVAPVDARKQYKESLEKSIANVKSNNETYKTLLNPGDETKIFEEFTSAFNNYLDHTQKIFTLEDTIDIEHVLLETQNEYENMSHYLEELEKLVSTFIDQAFEKAENSIGKTKNQTIQSLIISIIFSIACGGAIATNIVKSTRKILDGINEISEGNLNVNIEVTSQDEMKTIGDSVNSLVKSLSTMVENIKHISDKVAESSEELSAICEETSASNEEISSTVSELAIGASNQCEAVTESSKIINTMSDDIKSVAVNADSVSKSSEMVLDMTKDGMNKLNDAIEKIRNVESSTNEVADKINVLSNQSEKIGQIVETIQGLAEQTNLLALNAAIEAARAGEQGKGFAIVAEEVRKLAEESSISAESISTLIGHIQNEIVVAVNAINKGSENVAVGVNAVSVSGETFKNIFDEINSVVYQVKEVDILSREALKCSNDVVASIDGINEIAQNAAASAQEVASSSEEQNNSMDIVVRASETLAELGNELQDSISIFKY